MEISFEIYRLNSYCLPTLLLLLKSFAKLWDIFRHHINVLFLLCFVWRSLRAPVSLIPQSACFHGDFSLKFVTAVINSYLPHMFYHEPLYISYVELLLC